jgi:hypothetical protein
MRTLFTLALLCIWLPSISQVSEPYCAWEDGGSVYHIARVNPSTGILNAINSVPGMTGIVAPNTSVFKPTTGEYMCLAAFTSTIVWLRVDVVSGSILSTLPVTENWVGISYHCKNDTIYALRENNSAYELVWIDPVAATANFIANVPIVNAHVGSTFSIDPDSNTYTFQGLSGSAFVIVTLDLSTGTLLNQNTFSFNIPGQFFNCNDQKIYGLREDQQNTTYHLSEVQPLTGTVTPGFLLGGVTPGFISEGSTFSGARNQFTFRGFDAGNNPTIFAVDGATGNILGSAPMSERIAGLEDSLCCVCPLPVANFSLTNNAPDISLSNFSYGSPNMTVWDFGDGDTSHVQNPTHTYQQDGTYQVCLTVTNNCGDSTVCDSVVINTVGLGSSLLDGITVSPNPISIGSATDLIRVELPAVFSENVVVELRSVSGRVLLSKEVGGSFDLDVSGIAAGVYFLGVFDGNVRRTGIVVIEK